MIFLTSDTHAGHKHIIEFACRPFSTIEEMDEALIANWNRVVSPTDDVYHLGDVAFGSKSYIREFVGRLNGRIHLVLGNHDYRNIVMPRLERLFFEVADALVINYNGIRIHLSHYPYLCWMGRFRFEPQFHGHVHLHPGYGGADRDLMARIAHPTQYDVGVDLNGFTPISIDEALERVRVQVANRRNCYGQWCLD